MTNRSVSPLPKPSWPPHTHSTTSPWTMASSPLTSANMLALVRLQCMGHRLWPGASIFALPVFYRVSPSTNRAPLHRLSLCRSLCGAYVARPAHFTSHVSRFLAICLSRHRTLSRCAWKDVPKLATSCFLALLSPQSHQAGCPGHGGTQRKLPQCDASTHVFSSPQKRQRVWSVLVFFLPHARQLCFLAQNPEPPHCAVF